MIHKLINKLLGDQNKKHLNKVQPIVDEINSFEEAINKLSDEELKAKTIGFKEKLNSGKKEDDILPEAFAVVREAAKRTLGERHYDVQLIGGIVLHQNNIAEMKTGEGKTLVSTLAVYLNALSGKGVHVVTVNDYLAKRDAEWMSKVYNFLGLTVRYIIHGITNEGRKEAYNADITYGTNNEFGFDYLRDNMATRKKDLVQRPLNYAIIDEVDSILIDEARTPLIISAPNLESTNKYLQYSKLIPRLKNNEDYEVDEKARSAVLTEEGIAKMEKLLGMENIYTEAGFIEVNHIEQALKAYTLFQKDKDYVVNNDEVVIVDEFTGRLMPGRRFSAGLHQAIEAKEGVKVKRESKTLSTITFQNYFRLYKKLAGMTGTAITELEEFQQIYNLNVIVIPTNKPIIRDDKSDVIFKNERGKFKAIVAKVEEVNKTGQPILVGTISIEKSEELSKLLRRKKIPHQVLNAKHHEKEAEIITSAGQFSAVTIATNMAGRGTDIKLEQKTKDKGGLFILGTERHDSRRIDNQLRGRSGRQGDKGGSQFFISMEDNLPRLFGSQRIKSMMERLGIPDDMPIENGMISKAIESAQKKVEGHNFDLRKHVLQYDDVLNKQRTAIYSRRRNILMSDNVHSEILELIEKESQAIINNNINPEKNLPDLKLIEKTVQQVTGENIKIINSKDIETIDEDLKKKLIKLYEEKTSKNEEKFKIIEKFIYLRSIDNLWTEHIDGMSNLRNEVSLQGYGQRDPLQVYKQDSYRMFMTLLGQVQTNTIATLFHLNVEIAEEQKERKQVPVFTNENDIENITNNTSLQNSNTQKAVTNMFKPKNQNQEINKVGRNDPCSCGSGKKYKKCCGRNF